MASGEEQTMPDAPIRVHNHFVEAQANLTLSEQRILFFVCAFLIRQEDTDLRIPYRIKTGDFVKAFGLSHKDMYGYFDELTDNLMSRKVRIERPNSRGFQKINWLESTDYREGEGVLEITFTPKMKPYLIGLKSLFTEIGFLDFSGFKCKYSVWFLLLTAKWLKIGQKEFSVEELREKAGVEEGRYPKFHDFKRFVLVPAETEIKAKSGYYFSWEITGKQGKAAKRITLYFHRKAAIESGASPSPAPEALMGLGIQGELQRLGISEAKAGKLIAEESPDFLEWVVPKLKQSKAKAGEKGTKIRNHEAYCLRVLEDERSNFAAEWESIKRERVRQRTRVQEEKGRQASALKRKLDGLYADYRKRKIQEALKNSPDRAAILKDFEASLEGDRELFDDDFSMNRARQEFPKIGIDGLSVWVKARPFIEQRLGLTEAFTFKDFEREEGYRINDAGTEVVLLKDGERVEG